MITPALCLLVAAPAPLRGEALLNDLQHRAVRFFWEQSHPETGFTKDRASNYGADDHTVASCAATGFALAAYPIGVERKWLDRKQALVRTRKTLTALLTVHDGHEGWFYHFVDWKTGKRAWNCELSSIDTSILLAGAWVAREYWKDATVTKGVDQLTKRINWEFMMADTKGNHPHEFFNMGWTPEKGFIDATWAGYCELPMLYVQGYGASNVTTTAWDKVTRNVVTDRGYTFIEGGPLFMHQMSHVFYDFSEKRDRLGFNYWVATKNATLANRAYCIENPKKLKGYGPTFWGLTACDGPDGYRGYGAPPRTEDDGTVAPTCAIASLEYTPKESMQMAEGCYADYQYAYGTYGFSNGINPTRDWKGPDVLGIDLGMMLLGIENYRTGLPHRLSMSHPFVKEGFKKMGFKAAPGSNKGALQAKG